MPVNPVGHLAEKGTDDGNYNPNYAENPTELGVAQTEFHLHGLRNKANQLFVDACNDRYNYDDTEWQPLAYLRKFFFKKTRHFVLAKTGSEIRRKSE